MNKGADIVLGVRLESRDDTFPRVGLIDYKGFLLIRIGDTLIVMCGLWRGAPTYARRKGANLIRREGEFSAA